MKAFWNKAISFYSRIPLPWFFLAVCILAYGLLIPWQGFYLDDWYIVLFQKYFGAGNFSEFFQNDRPLFGLVYQVFVPIFRDSRIAWQIFGVFAHALAVTCFWWLLVKLMPARKKLAAVAALLFAVYPGFQFHWFSVMYSQVFVLSSFYFLSFILMIEAIKRERGGIWFTLSALVCLFIGVVPSEYNFGIEVIRPIILFILVYNLYPTTRQRLLHVFLRWLPYLGLMAGFVVYRLGFGNSYSYEVSLLSDLRVMPIQTILRLIGEVFWSAVDATVIAWTNLLDLLKRDLLSSVSIVMILLIIIGMIVTWLSLKNRTDEKEQSRKNSLVMIIGLFATITAMIPFIAGSFKITLDFPNNRYLIALAPGACLFLAAVIDSLFRSEKQKLFTACLLIGFAIGSQFLVARSFMLTWKAQQDFFWQLSWRAPGLRQNTLLLTEDLPFSKYFSGTSLTAPLNLIYAPDLNTHDIPYLIILETQQREVVPDYLPNLPINYDFRSFNFSGNTSNMLVIKKSADGCLLVASPMDAPETFAKYDDLKFWKNAIPLSNLDRIIAVPEDQAIPQVNHFGSENKNQWCYYFEKADLSRQIGEWAQTIQYYQAAEAEGFHPLVEAEWLPLVEAYLKTGEIDKAFEITKEVVRPEQGIASGFCGLWTNNAEDKNVLPYAEEILSWLNCEH